MQQYRLEPSAPPAPPKPSRSFGRGLVMGAIAFLIVAFLTLAGLIVAYAQIAADLPLPGDLAKQASSFQSTRIYDHNGELLRTKPSDPNEGRRVAASLNKCHPGCARRQSPQKTPTSTAILGWTPWHWPGLSTTLYGSGSSFPALPPSPNNW